MAKEAKKEIKKESVSKKENDVGTVITESFKEYFANWKTFLGIMIIFTFIPTIIFTIFEILWFSDIFKSGLSDMNTIINSFFNTWLYFMIGMFFVMVLLGIWGQSSLLFNMLYRKKAMGVGESISGGKKYYGKMFALSLLIFVIFMIPLLIFFGTSFWLFFSQIGTTVDVLSMLIGLSCIFAAIVYSFFLLYLGIKWIFSAYILIDQNKDIIESLRISSEMVKRKWWITFGVLALFTVIIYVISLAFSMPSMAINTMINPAINNSSDITSIANNFSSIFIVSMIIGLIFNMISQAIIVPLFMILIKNFYLVRKEGSSW